MRIGQRLIAIIICLSYLSACQQGFRTADKPITDRQGGNKVALMPLDVLLSELTAGGLQEANALWTEQAKKNLSEGIRNNPAFSTLEVIDVTMPPADTPDEKIISSFQRLHAAVGNAIMIHSFQPAMALPTKGNKLDWTLGPLSGDLRERTKAHYALFLHLKDSYASAGRVALIVTSALLFGVAPPGGAQIGFVSLVDLETGNIVWFNHVSRNAGDLRNPASAQESINALLLGFPLRKDCPAC